jgi:hypothetical protein
MYSENKPKRFYWHFNLNLFSCYINYNFSANRKMYLIVFVLFLRQYTVICTKDKKVGQGIFRINKLANTTTIEEC